MRQLLQHRLKTNIAGKTGSVQPAGNYVKKFLSGGFGQSAIWSDGLDCSGGGTIAVRSLEENGPLNWTDASGITVTKDGIIQALTVAINPASTSPS